MKKRFYVLVVSFMLASVVFTGCKYMEMVQDPNGKPQEIADKVDEAVDTAERVVGYLPIPSPWKEAVLGVIAVAGAAAGAVQNMKKKKVEVRAIVSETANAEIVEGFEKAKKAGALVITQDAAKIINTIQTRSTKEIVDRLQSN